MTDLQDYELDERHRASRLRRDADTSAAHRSVGRGGGAVAAAGAAAYLAFAWRPRPAPASAPHVDHLGQGAYAAAGRNGRTIPIPPLDASDAVVRTLVRALSEHPAVTAWLATNGLIRNFTVVVANIADGATPAKHLKVLRPSSAFRVVERDGNPTWTREATIDMRRSRMRSPRSTRLGPPGSMRPSSRASRRRIGSWDLPIGRSTRRLNARSSRSSTRRIVDGPVRLRPKGIGYAYRR